MNKGYRAHNECAERLKAWLRDSPDLWRNVRVSDYAEMNLLYKVARRMGIYGNSECVSFKPLAKAIRELRRETLPLVLALAALVCGASCRSLANRTLESLAIERHPCHCGKALCKCQRQRQCDSEGPVCTGR